MTSLRALMRILALETSSKGGSVAVLEDGRLLAQTVFRGDQRTAEAFAPAIARQLDEAGWQPREIQLVAVTRGPGSFTGLRVGVTAAKALAYATGAEVIGVNTLEAIAWQAPGSYSDLHVVMDAQRKQVFAARYRGRAEPTRVCEEVQAVSIVDNRDWLQSLEEGSTVTGPGLARLALLLPDNVEMLDKSFWAPQASTVGHVGYQAYARGRRDDLWKFAPDYYRKSAAEEKRDREQSRS